MAEKDGKYYMYFPLKDKNDIFHIGVAVSDKPEGPFIPQSDPIRGSYSIDPAILMTVMEITICILVAFGAGNYNVIIITRLWRVPRFRLTTNQPFPHGWPG